MEYFIINRKSNVVEAVGTPLEEARLLSKTHLWVPHTDFTKYPVEADMFWEKSTNTLRNSTDLELESHYTIKLDSTDWKVTRHRDQVELGLTTSLTDEEYLNLLQLRQKWRNATN
jgi:hypothetical protein